MDYSSAWSSGRAEIRRNSDSGNDAPRYCFTLWWHPRRCPSLPSHFNRQVSRCHGQPIRRPGRVASSPDLKLTFLLPIAVDQPPWRSQSTVPISSSGSQCDNIAFFSSFSSYSDNLRSPRSLRYPSSDPAPLPPLLRSPRSLPRSPWLVFHTMDSFWCFPICILYFPHACVILRSLLDSLR